MDNKVADKIDIASVELTLLNKIYSLEAEFKERQTDDSNHIYPEIGGEFSNTANEITETIYKLSDYITGSSESIENKKKAFQIIIKAIITLRAKFQNKIEYIRADDDGTSSYGGLASNTIYLWINIADNITDRCDKETRKALREIIFENEDDVAYWFNVDAVDMEAASDAAGIGKFNFLYTDEEYNAKVLENRKQFENFLEQLKPPLTVDLLNEGFRILTEELFYKKYQFIRSNYKTTFGRRKGTEPENVLTEINNWLARVNKLITSRSIINTTYLTEVADLMVKLADIHPFADWNGTMAMYWGLYMTKQKFHDKKITFITNNTKMIAYILNNNAVAMFKFYQGYSNLSSDKSFKERATGHMRKYIKTRIKL